MNPCHNLLYTLLFFSAILILYSFLIDSPKIYTLFLFIYDIL